MSWFKPTVVAGSLIFILSCGFQPLYQKNEGGSAAGNALATIKVKPIPDRTGQELRNHLFDALTPRGQPVNPIWELTVNLQESIEPISLDQTSFSTRANLHLSGQYQLTPLEGNNVEGHSGSVSVVSSYNIVDSEYATLIAERDARSKAVFILSNDIRRALAIWFTNRAK